MAQTPLQQAAPLNFANSGDAARHYDRCLQVFTPQKFAHRNNLLATNSQTSSSYVKIQWGNQEIQVVDLRDLSLQIGDFTPNNCGNLLAIVLDKINKVIEEENHKQELDTSKIPVLHTILQQTPANLDLIFHRLFPFTPPPTSTATIPAKFPYSTQSFNKHQQI